MEHRISSKIHSVTTLLEKYTYAPYQLNFVPNSGWWVSDISDD